MIWGGIIVHSEIRRLIYSVWNNEEVPHQWKVSLIVPVHTKGDKSDCRNITVISYIQNFIKCCSVRANPTCRQKYCGQSMWIFTEYITSDHIFCIYQIQWALESRTVWFSNNLKLEQKIWFETQIKIWKLNHEHGIAQHHAACATVSQQIRTRLVECCWLVCTSVCPVLP